MSPGTLIGILVTVFGSILIIFFYMNDSLDNRIEKAISHPEFILKVAEHTKLPFLIFDEGGTFKIESGGATTLIGKIESFSEKDENGNKRFAGFVVYPKQFLGTPPILQAINHETVFLAPKRINTIDWKYRIPMESGLKWAVEYDELPPKLYKIEIIK